MWKQLKKVSSLKKSLSNFGCILHTSDITGHFDRPDKSKFTIHTALVYFFRFIWCFFGRLKALSFRPSISDLDNNLDAICEFWRSLMIRLWSPDFDRRLPFVTLKSKPFEKLFKKSAHKCPRNHLLLAINENRSIVLENRSRKSEKSLNSFKIISACW